MHYWISIRNNTLIISVFAFVTATLIAATYVFTAPLIHLNQEKFQAALLYEIMPSDDADFFRRRHLVDDTFNSPHQMHYYYQNIRNKNVLGVILATTTPHGYSGDIELLVGIWRDGSLAGVRISQHQETPGLGDKIELRKSDWILGFNDHHWQPESDPLWAVKKEGGMFDQFTGATITPRAVIRQVAHALAFFEAHKQRLLTPLEMIDN